MQNKISSYSEHITQKSIEIVLNLLSFGNIYFLRWGLHSHITAVLRGLGPLHSSPGTPATARLLLQWKSCQLVLGWHIIQSSYNSSICCIKIWNSLIQLFLILGKLCAFRQRCNFGNFQQFFYHMFRLKW